MDVNRLWRRGVGHGEYNCGRFTVLRYLGSWEVWDEETAKVLTHNLPSLGDAKRWIKDNWRALEKIRKETD